MLQLAVEEYLLVATVDIDIGKRETAVGECVHQFGDKHHRLARRDILYSIELKGDNHLASHLLDSGVLHLYHIVKLGTDQVDGRSLCQHHSSTGEYHNGE